MGLPEPPELGAAALPKGTFDGQAVLVTGGGTGLGKAIAVEFARLGAAVGILSREEEHRAAGVAAVEAVGGRAMDAGCDIRQPDQIAAAFDAIEKALGLPATLVNNAAGNFPVPAEDFPLSAAYEATSEMKDDAKHMIFCKLQALNRVHLVIAVGADHMYDAAMESKACCLTAGGRYFWRLAKDNRI